MICHCHCHEIEFTTNKFFSTYGCPSCAYFHTPPPDTVKVTPENVKAIIAETTVAQEHAYEAVTYLFRVKTSPDILGDVMVKVAVAASLAKSSWMDAGDMALIHLCGELNKQWAATGQPEWVAYALKNHPTKSSSASKDTLTPYVEAIWGQQVALQQQNAQVFGAQLGSFYTKNPGESVGGDTIVRDLSEWLPGLNTTVPCPAMVREPCVCLTVDHVVACGQPGTERCGYQHALKQMIVHLNDHHVWTREQVADWLESLDIDLSFPVDGPPPKKKLPPADRGQRLVIIANTYAQGKEEAYRRNRGPSECLIVPTQTGSGSAIRGMRRFQYFVCAGTAIIPPLKDLLAYSEAREVGEESNTLDDVKAAKYYEKIQELVAKASEQYIVPPKIAGQSYHMSFLDELSLPSSFKKGQWVEFLLQKSADLDLEPHEVHLGTKSVPTSIKCTGPNCGVCKLIKANYMAEAEKELDPKAKALDEKKKNGHTAFTVNPTKKNPFKKK